MAMERFDDDLNIIAGLGDDPKRDDGLSTQGFKSIFDKAGLLIQEFINNKLIPYIEKQNVGLPLGGGTMEGPINMNGQKLTGLNAPTADDEAANKGYVDTAKEDAESYTDEQVKKAAPYNYAHNSDFTQWVNQAGFGSSHADSVEKYAGDRWILDSGTVTGDAREDGNGYTNIKLNGTIRQKVANAPEVGTSAIEMVSGTATILYADGEITITSNGGVIKNVRLFKGNIAADNMAAYRPKGYGVELDECQLYFNNLSVNAFLCNTAAGVVQLHVRFPTMRVIPTVSYVGNQITSVDHVSNSSAVFNGQSGNTYVSYVSLSADL